MKRVALLAFLVLLPLSTLAWKPVGRSKYARCEVEGSLPDRACTPGDVETTSLAVICGASTRRRRHVSEDVHRRVFREYGLGWPAKEGAYEVDHLIPLELGGSNDIANLWPQAAPGYKDKDRLEDHLHDLVCQGRMRIEDAQRAMATDWTEASRR